jgi:dihydrolipoamide dehydrogenase
VFIVGDANGRRPLLHEASDEGRIAGYNALADDVTCFQKRTALAIAFSDPNMAVIGKSHAELVEEGADFVTGESAYDRQGRALMMGRNEGLVRLYAAKKDDRLLGAELVAPEGEHLAHLIAWATACGMTASDVLSMPFYHPVLEEGLRKAFREAAKASDSAKLRFEMLRCQDAVVG